MNVYEHILLVEDDADDRDLFREALEEIMPGTQMSTAANGFLALDMLQKQQPLPQVIFLDQLLPVMDGYELLQEIKKDPKLEHLPVVVLSGSNFRDKEYYLAGADLCLQKPSSMGSLRFIIQEVLSRDIKKDAELLRYIFTRQRN